MAIDYLVGEYGVVARIFYDADCGIINYWFCDDNGAILTAYALQKSLEKLGYSNLLIDVGMINRSLNGISKKFEMKYLKTTLPTEKEKLASLNEKFKYFIVGSDQVFRREWVPDSFFLDFVNNRNKKIAVSASFGTDSLNCSFSQKREISYWLRRFDALSSRELSGIKLFKQLGVNGQCIIDPVFWMNAEDYISNLKLTRQAREHVAVYFRDVSEKKKRLIESIRKEICDKIVVLNDDTEVESFVQGIGSAKLLITDSYHGVCFAIIFHTQFLCTMNELRGNARFDSLMDVLGLNRNNFISEDIAVDKKEIEKLSSEWDKIDRKINMERDIALKWISNALNRKRSIGTYLRPVIYNKKNIIKDSFGKLKYYVKRRIGAKYFSKNMVCYGAGFYGKKATELLRGRIDFFIDRDPNKKLCEGYYVYTLKKAKKIMNSNTTIVLTVDKNKQNEIRDTLEKEGYRNVICLDSIAEEI